MNEATVFNDDGGYRVSLKVKSEKELEEIKRRLSGMFSFRTPKR